MLPEWSQQLPSYFCSSSISKGFKKVIATQITIFLNINKILFNGKHGFRLAHSWETALHELLTDINSIDGKKLKALLLFIDFRKAFDLVDSNLELLKLFHYGFDNNSMLLIANFLSNRVQKVKYNNILSTYKPINLGIPQGSVLGLLFFLILINDFVFNNWLVQ